MVLDKGGQVLMSLFGIEEEIKCFIAKLLKSGICRRENSSTLDAHEVIR